ncbi:myo-inositol 2-dehydrogenase / D-chiro-inositol 1-dehydrogenase [Monaibacterium marinum]|uniref:Myo-inositol 2-dehydrogenase / D-chiro-inositol 1-dehydrogenase n=1 Tax=Pontivivens marinum TaxID=1690039 RepID=A0A2C9CNR2_9RHOB|nr:inositol 2-dehydrogenase [Monaibacterium marinum]SOH92848.1 myo-inositol 2-dehydrogenase / D-chiro-inositol 1-dehydrogenase [Monaibacterium marinum]
MLNIGILGCGRIGQVHARSIAQMVGARVSAVSDAIPAAAQALAASTASQAMDSDALINSPDVDAVIIGTPTTTHFDLIHQAAAAGKAIFCEKPVDLSTERIRTCLDTINATGVPFMVAFNRRFDPNFAHLQQSLRDGVVGNVEMVTILSRDPTPPPVSYIESSGGIFRDMMIHDLDMARFLLGEDPVELHAMGSCLVDPGIGAAGDMDTATVTLKTASGRICQISNSRRATYGYDQRVEVHGSKGMIRAHNELENNVELATTDGFTHAPTKNFFLERYAAAYLAEMNHFMQAVTAGTAPKPDGMDGLKAQYLADLATESSRDGLIKSCQIG